MDESLPSLADSSPTGAGAPQAGGTSRWNTRLGETRTRRLGPAGAPGAGDEAEGAPAGRPFGRYRLLDELGRGGMGRVWRAWDTSLGRLVALKQLLDPKGNRAEEGERFRREARLAAKLNHPHIIRVLDVGDVDGQDFFTTEYVVARSLEQVGREPVPVERAAAWVKQIGEALAYAHGEGVIHRDIKPANILIDAAGKPWLTDFGLAKQFSVDGSRALTLPGEVVGTPKYMSPEQALGETDRLGPATDQFSLGVVLYELLAGRPPFAGENLGRLLHVIAEEDPFPPASVREGVPSDIEAICLKALEKDPRCRYPSVAEMVADIGRFQEGESVQARPSSPAVRFLRRAARHRALFLPIASVVVLGVGLVLLALLGLGGGSVPRAALIVPGAGAALLALAIGAYAFRAQEAQAARRRADSERAAAERALVKGRLAQRVLARWAYLLGPLREMEADFYDSTLSPEEKGRRASLAWPAFERFERETPDDMTSRATMLALLSWAERLAGGQGRAFELAAKSQALDPDLPFGFFTEALGWFSEWMEKQPLPAVRSGPLGIEFGPPPPESPAWGEARRKMEALVTRAMEARVWGQDVASEFREVLDSARAIQAGEYAKAEEALTRALAAPDLKAFEAGILLARARARYLRKEFEAGIADLQEVLRIRPRQAEAYGLLWDVTQGLLEEVIARGGDRVELLDALLAYAQKACELDPSHVSGLSCSSFAGHAQKACEQDRSRAEHRVRLGRTRLARCRCQWRKGEEALPLCQEALAEFDRAIELDPGCAGAWFHRGRAMHTRAWLCDQRGEDPTPSFERCAADLTEALRAGADPYDAHVVRAGAHSGIASHLTFTGQDGRAASDRELADTRSAIELRPESAESYFHRASAATTRAWVEGAVDGDPEPWYVEAIAAYGDAIERLPEYYQAWVQRGWRRIHLACARGPEAEDVRPLLREAIADFTRAIRLGHKDWLPLSGRAEAHSLLGHASWTRGEEGLDSVALAWPDIEEALRLSPRNGEVLRIRSGVHGAEGLMRESRGEDPRPHFLAAVADLEEANRLEPGIGYAHSHRFYWTWRLADCTAARGEDPSPLVRQAMVSHAEALRCNPREFSRITSNQMCPDVLEQCERRVYALALDVREGRLSFEALVERVKSGATRPDWASLPSKRA